MPETAPLLSLCIPTHNRASFLEATLTSLTRQTVFQCTDEIEIVVSDNSSSDETPRVIAAFKEQFPTKITSLTTVELVDPNVNFALALEKGRGLLRKLHNDTLLVKDGFLEKFLHLIRQYEPQRPILFFLNGRNIRPVRAERTLCRGLDSFIGHTSFYSTWIGAFALWNDDLPRYAPLFHQAAHHFIQTEILFLALGSGRDALVYNPEFGETAEAPKAVTKEHLESVYFAEYLPLLRQSALAGHVRERTLQKEIRRFCLVYYVPYYHKLSGEKFTASFLRDFRFIRDHAPALQYYTTCLFYLLFCLVGRAARRHRELAWKIRSRF
jgi:glycosyltransferase involved in cell wall biosynthesis